MRIFHLDEHALRSSIEFAVTAELALCDASANPDSAPPHAVDELALGERLFALTAWSCLVEPGDSVAALLVSVLGAARALQLVVERASPAQILAALGDADAMRSLSGVWMPQVEESTIAEGIARWRPRLASAPVLEALAAARRGGLRLIVPGSAAWPASLDDLGPHAPLCVWARGEVRTLEGVPAIAIVGARAATSYGEHVAMEMSAELTARGAVVVSGAAYGIDGMAHRAALAAGGKTIAVLAGGADRAYPAGHADLLDRVCAAGVVLSELPPGAAPTRWRFLARNRLIAALGQATIVVEAGWRSGSLNTAAHAATLGRPIGAVPGPVTSAASAGCHRLLREFDARCVTSADDVLELVGVTPGPLMRGGPAAAKSGDRTDDATRVVDALSTRNWRSASDVARRAGMSVAQAEGVLGLLGLEGRAERGDSGWRAARQA